MKDKFVSIAKVGEKGQIVIPKEAREMFDIKSGDSIIVLCDKQKGIALLKAAAINAVVPFSSISFTSVPNSISNFAISVALPRAA